MLTMPGVDEKLNLDEDLFCARYELEILSGIVNYGMLERWVPGFCNPQTHKEHVYRYDWIKDFVQGKAVLDIACGTGYGSFKMAEEGGAASVMARDIDRRTVRYASIRNRHPRIGFDVADAETISFENEFDIITSFETIEHLGRPEDFLRNANKALRPDGIFFVSTPISAMEEDHAPLNKYHRTEWGFRRFQDLVAKHLSVSQVFLQLMSVPKKVDNGIPARLLRKAGLVRDQDTQIIERLVPHKWNQEEVREDSLGTRWAGYQILQCKKK
jgi:2-polyprenyl-3-methyl-5-hydroxy-6-metoxy-1,4-benzoquinol methylase